MSTFHIPSRPAYRPKRPSVAMLFLLALVTVLAVAPASAASNVPIPFRTDEPSGGQATHATDPAATTDAPTETPPSTSALKAAPAMLYGSSTTTSMIRWSSSGSSFTRYSSYWSTARSSYNPDLVGNRMVSGDFNGDGVDDIATAYDYGTYFQFHVWLNGVSSPVSWYQSGPLSLVNVQGRLVAGDWNGDGRDDLALGYDYGSGTARIFRFFSSGSSFTLSNADWMASTYDLSRVENRMTAGDVNGDGRDDVVMAYDYTTFFRLHVWLSGSSYQGGWYEGTPCSLTSVQGRIVTGDWNGDGRDDLALASDLGSYTVRIFRFFSSGSSFTSSGSAGDWISGTGSYNLSEVGDRVAAGDVNGDGKDDVVMGYAYDIGVFKLHIWLNGVSSPSTGYQGSFTLGNVQNRFVLGRW